MDKTILNDVKGKKLLVLGGSLWKDAIKKFAEKYGIVLIATGNDKNAGIFEIADECYEVDSTDSEAMKELILSQKIDGVYMGGSEAVISAACEYLHELKMPCYCKKEQWETVQNKGNLKRLFTEFGLPVVPRYEYKIDELNENADKISFPVITKPIDGCGSSGFSICTNIKELKDGYNRAAENSSSGDVMIEKFVKNKGVVVFYTFSDGKMIFSGIENKYPIKYTENGSYVVGMLTLESHLAQEFRQKFDDKLNKMFEHIGMKEGTIWIEVFYDNENYYFNEAGYRYGGSVTIYPVDYFYGINQVYADMFYALSGTSKISGWPSLIKENVPRKKHYCIYPLYLKSGTIFEVIGLQDVEALDVTVKVVTAKGKGDTVKPSGTFSQNFGMVHFVFETLDEFKATVRKIDSLIKVYDSNGESMLYVHDDAFLDKVTV